MKPIDEGEHDEASAPHDDGGERVESGAAEHCDGIEVYEHPATTSTELFVHDREEDRVLLDWLRERPEHPRCSALLRQIMEWTGKCQKAEMRSLAKAQGITIRRQERANVEKLREAVRRHFKAAVGQEKGRLACFQLSTARGASERLDSLASESEHALTAAEVVDLETLFLLRRQQKADMPDHLQQAIRRLGGGYRASKQNLRDIAKLLGMSMQALVRYPSADKKNRARRLVVIIDALRMTMLRNNCLRQVRAWATISPVLQSMSLSSP